MADNKAPLMAFLTTEGYVPTADDQGNIAFKREGRTYLSFTGDGDPLYFNLYCFMSYADMVTSRDKALVAANEINRSIKAIKITLPDDADPSKVTFGIEALLPEENSFQPIFERALAIITLCIDQFSAKVSSARPFRAETPVA